MYGSSREFMAPIPYKHYIVLYFSYMTLKVNFSLGSNKPNASNTIMVRGIPIIIEEANPEEINIEEVTLEEEEATLVEEKGPAVEQEQNSQQQRRRKNVIHVTPLNILPEIVQLESNYLSYYNCCYI